MKHINNKIIDGLGIIKESGISPKTLSELPATIKWAVKLKSGSWDSYFKNVIYNLSEYKHLYHTPGYSATPKEDLSRNITKELIAYIRKEWEDIPDKSIKSSDYIKWFVTDVMSALVRLINNPNPSSAFDLNTRGRNVQSYIKYYDDNYKTRNVPFKKYVELTLKAIEERLVKKMRVPVAGLPKAMDLVKLYLTGTPLDVAFKSEVVPPKPQVPTKARLGKIKF